MIVSVNSYLPQLRTRRLTLVPLMRIHAEDFYALESDPSVVAHQSYGPQSLAESEKYARESEESWMSGPSPEWQEFAILHKQTFIGRIGFEHANRVATVWLAIMPDAQGLGFASEALNAVLAYGAGSGMTGFEANCSVANSASAALLLRCGFQEVESTDGDLRQFRRPLVDVDRSSNGA